MASAVDQLLLGQRLELLGSGEIEAFDHSRCSERPVRDAVALVLDSGDRAFLAPIFFPSERVLLHAVRLLHRARAENVIAAAGGGASERTRCEVATGELFSGQIRKLVDAHGPKHNTETECTQKRRSSKPEKGTTNNTQNIPRSVAVVVADNGSIVVFEYGIALEEVSGRVAFVEGGNELNELAAKHLFGHVLQSKFSSN